jgi:ammonium transporter Rh
VYTVQDSLLPKQGSSFKPSKAFGWTALAIQLILIVCFAVGTVSSSGGSKPLVDTQQYNYYVGVSLMMLVGFGYLMTFMRWYGLGAVGLTMFITALGVQVSLLIEPVFASGFHEIPINIMALLNANFAVAAFLISFGGLIGKVNPLQLLALVVCEAICYSANKQLICTHWLNTVDAGGTIIIHMFGAYFGLAVAWMIGRPVDTAPGEPSTVSDVFSLIGTTFLWVYWPSFVAGAIPSGTVESELALTQTVLSLLGSTVVTFALSVILDETNKLRPVDIQNATLAGGVAIGAVASLPIGPAAALGTGVLAGTVSTFGFARIQDKVESMGLHDSCGIHNLHGMPSLVGGLVSVVYAATAGTSTVTAQLGGIGMTLITAIVTGSLTGLLLISLKDKDKAFANDQSYWTVADGFGKEL